MVNRLSSYKWLVQQCFACTRYLKRRRMNKVKNNKQIVGRLLICTDRHCSCINAPGLTHTSSTFCSHSVFVCFVWIWEQTAIISLYSINRLVCMTETECLLRGTDWIIQVSCPERVSYYTMTIIWGFGNAVCIYIYIYIYIYISHRYVLLTSATDGTER